MNPTPRLLISALCFVTCLCPGLGMAREQLHPSWAATCVQTIKVHDGDTLTCVGDPEGHGTFVVRFAGIDAPETGQAYWRVSRDHLRGLAVPGTVAECYKLDRYGREVCRLKSATGDDLADSMIRNGMAWHAVQYAAEESPSEPSGMLCWRRRPRPKNRVYGPSQAPRLLGIVGGIERSGGVADSQGQFLLSALNRRHSVVE